MPDGAKRIIENLTKGDIDNKHEALLKCARGIVEQKITNFNKSQEGK